MENRQRHMLQSQHVILTSITLFWISLPLAGHAQATHACVVQPSAEVAVSVQVAGVLSDVAVRRGDTVAAGDVLARVADGPERAAYAIALQAAEDEATLNALRDRLRVAQERRDRAESLRARDLMTQGKRDEAEQALLSIRADLTEAESARTRARLELERARIALDRMTVRSAIDATVTDVVADAGEYASPENPILQLAALDPLRIDAYLPTALYGSVAPGDTVTVLPEQPVGGRHEARVESVDTVFEAVSATFLLRATLDNPDTTLPAGYRCQLALPDTTAEESAPTD